MSEQPKSLEQHWRIANITVADLSDRPFETTNRDLATDVSYVHLVRPSYQRSLVWKRQKAEEFRTSISRGYPFGVVVLAHEGVVEKVDGMALRHHRYRIIDGQQRIYWLNKMRTDFFTDGWYLDPQLPDVRVLDVFTELAAVLGLSIDHAESQRLARATTGEPGAVADPHTLLQRFIQVSGVKSPVTEDVLGKAFAAASKVWTYLDSLKRAFSDSSVPALIVETELVQQLPDVFVKLNSGLRLSRFDIFAADWALVELNLDDAVKGGRLDQALADELLKHSQSRLSDADVEESEYEVQLSENDEAIITLYEYLYALSKHICAKFPFTIGSIPRADEELVLNVASILFAGDISRMDTLATNHPRDSNGDLDASTFPTALLGAAEAINDALLPLLSWDLGKAIDPAHPTRRRSVPNAFGLLQAAAYMSAYVANVFDVGPRQIKPRPAGSGVLGTITDFKKSLRSWYLLDAVESPFKGADAYANVSSRVWANFGTKSPNSAMTGPVDLLRLATAVRDYVESGLEVDLTPQRRRLDQPGTGAILRLTYVGMPASSNEDRDHVIPLGALNAVAAAPANHVANWMPLNQTDNRSRGAALWADCIEEGRFDSRRNQIKTMLLVEPGTCGASAAGSLAGFKSFLTDRFSAMAPKIVNNLHHPDVDKIAEAVKHFHAVPDRLDRQGGGTS